MKSSALTFTVAAALAGSLAWTTPARAESCVNDINCKLNGTACGTDICNYGAAGMTCMPAETGPKGSDGWCTTDSDCKCKAQGATCTGIYCSFTKAPAGSGSGSGPPTIAPR